MFTPSDIQQIEAHGLTTQQVDAQLERFRKGFRHCELVRPATVGDGIVRLSEEDIDALSAAYDQSRSSLCPVKFVPASGAATRMFKSLQEFLDTGIETEFTNTFFAQLPSFAFYPRLAASGVDLTDKRATVAALIAADGLAYANLPKALLDFHTTDAGARTSIEEHLVEAASYATDGEGVCRLHFTVSPQHRTGLIQLLETVRPAHETRLNVRFDFQFSEQHASTDTVAATENNALYRDTDKQLVFRPAGHGALLENLNNLDAQLVFVKNIDNVVHEAGLAATVRYKKALAGVLLRLQSTAREIAAETATNPTAEVLTILVQRAQNELLLQLPASCTAAQLAKAIHRPIRVCGMVPNTGEPGGGPFWVKDSAGNISLQIVEKAQVDLANPDQQQLLEGATHFNPVDLVCAIADANNQSFDLRHFRDDDQFFITEKSHNGQPIKALELPGLWNGGMAGWITVFVEVPIETFNPVKTVNDLLKAGHQPQ